MTKPTTTQTQPAGRSARPMRRTILTALATTVFTPLMYAQAKAAEPVQVDEVVVTADRRSATAIMDVPMAVQAFSGERLKQLHVGSMADLSTVAPSFTVSRSYQGTPQYSIRGIGFNAVNMSATPTVTLYQDEIAYPYPFTQLGPMFDIESVAVLKGPQGTQFGRNTTAGVINIVSAKPTKTFAAANTVEVGNYNTVNLEGFVSGPISETLQGRIAYRFENSYEGWQVSNTRPGETLGKVHNSGLRGALAWQPNDRLSVDFTLSGWMNRSDTRAGQGFALTPSIAAGVGRTAQANNPAFETYFDQFPLERATQADWTPESSRGEVRGLGIGLPGRLREDTSFYAGGLRIAYDFSDTLRLVSLTGYNKLDRNSLQDVSGVPYEVLVQNPTGSIETISQELRLEGEHGPVKWTLGAYYGKDTINESIRGLISGNANSRAIRGSMGLVELFGSSALPEAYQALDFGDEDTAFRTLVDEANFDVTTRSVLANIDWSITDTLTLTMGARYTEDRQRVEGCTRDFNGNTAQGVNSSVALLIWFNANTSLIPLAPVKNGECVTTNFLQSPPTRGLQKSETNEDNVAWRLALNWQPSDDLTLYASASQGAKSGVTPVNTANSVIQLTPVKQEILRAYEVGGRADLGQARVSLGAFYYDYKDKQLSGYHRDIVFTTLARLVNVPDSAAYGAEAELSVRATDHLTLAGSATYLVTKVKDYIGIDELGADVSFDGARFPNASTWMANATVLYDRPLSDGLGLRGALNYRWQSAANAGMSNDPNYAIDPYGLLNGSLGVYGDRWEVSVWGKNLTNTYYPVSINSNANVIFKIPGMPVTYGASLTVKF